MVHPSHPSATMKFQAEWGSLLVRFLFCSVGAVLGFKSLTDPDLGWHLATGLWIIDHRHLPGLDPFGVGHSFYLAYSWLFDVALAVLYRFGGWHALQVAQSALIALCSYQIVALVHDASREIAAKHEPKTLLLSETFTVALSLPLVASVWHLRPQLVSVILFSVLLRKLITHRGSPSGLLLFVGALTILWANTHVYWLLAPGTWLVFQVLRPEGIIPAVVVRSVAMFLTLTLLGMLNPYGAELYRGMWEYAFHHHAGYQLIREFQPLSFSAGYAPYLFALIILIIILSLRRGIQVALIWQLALFALLGCASIIQIKYLALFSVIAAPLLATGSLPLWVERLESLKSRPAREASTSSRLALVVAPLLFLVALGLAFENQPPLAAQTQELFSVTPGLFQRCSNAEQRIVNHFDDGGWLALAFYERQSEHEHGCRTAIDGRTLVMGQALLQEFDRWRRGEAGCEFVERSGAGVAIFQKPAKGIREDLLPICFRDWQRDESANYWTLFSRDSGAHAMPPPR